MRAVYSSCEGEGHCPDERISKPAADREVGQVSTLLYLIYLLLVETVQMHSSNCDASCICSMLYIWFKRRFEILYIMRSTTCDIQQLFRKNCKLHIEVITAIR